jgi:peroxiredoxin
MAGPAGRIPRRNHEIHCPMTLLPAGTPAPDFSATASDGKTYRLSRLLKESRVLLVFYPGNNTPG